MPGTAQAMLVEAGLRGCAQTQPSAWMSTDCWKRDLRNWLPNAGHELDCAAPALEQIA
jgi:hypothetical protein